MIKWINPKNDKDQRLIIESHLVARGYNPTIKEYRNVGDFLLELGRDKIDILITSAQSVNTNEFESMIKKATKRYPFDVLYYGVKANPTTKSRLSLYSTVRAIQSRQFVNTLLEMIDDNPSKWHTPRFIRGLVISRSVDLEAAMDDYIINYLTLHRKSLDVQMHKKLYKIMYDYALAMRSKRLILEMIMVIDGKTNARILKLIDVIAAARNRLAHTWLDVDDTGTVVASHTKHKSRPSHTFDKTRLWKTLQDIDEVILYLDYLTHR